MIIQKSTSIIPRHARSFFVAMNIIDAVYLVAVIVLFLIIHSTLTIILSVVLFFYLILCILSLIGYAADLPKLRWAVQIYAISKIFVFLVLIGVIMFIVIQHWKIDSAFLPWVFLAAITSFIVLIGCIIWIYLFFIKKEEKVVVIKKRFIEVNTDLTGTAMRAG